MADTFKFELVSPERTLLEGDALQVMVPGASGDLTVLPGHAPLISTLRPGVLDVSFRDGRKRVLVKDGFAEVEPDRLTILARRAIDVASLSAARLADELTAAEAELAAAQGDDDTRVAHELIAALRSLEASGRAVA